PQPQATQTSAKQSVLPTKALEPAVVDAEPARPGLRLPHDVRPLRHAATLTVDPAKDTFEGAMEIEVEVEHAPLSVLWLHADGLEIDRAEALPLGARSARIPARVLPGGRDLVGLRFEAPVRGSKVLIRMAYRGQLSRTEIEGASRQNEGGD